MKPTTSAYLRQRARLWFRHQPSCAVVDFSQRHGDTKGSGTGFVWDESGLIVTNFHVVYGASKITVTLQSGNSYEAEIVARHQKKTSHSYRSKRQMRRSFPCPGDSNQLAVGRKVLAIGNPFAGYNTHGGCRQCTRARIKSMNNRTISGVIQTDAISNPGNSGGPLLNSKVN